MILDRNRYTALPRSGVAFATTFVDDEPQRGATISTFQSLGWRSSTGVFRASILPICGDALTFVAGSVMRSAIAVLLFSLFRALPVRTVFSQRTVEWTALIAMVSFGELARRPGSGAGARIPAGPGWQTPANCIDFFAIMSLQPSNILAATAVPDEAKMVQMS